MGLASSLKKVASKSLVKLGGSVTIRQVTNGSYDTANGTVSESNSDIMVNNSNFKDLIYIINTLFSTLFNAPYRCELLITIIDLSKFIVDIV